MEATETNAELQRPRLTQQQEAQLAHLQALARVPGTIRLKSKPSNGASPRIQGNSPARTATDATPRPTRQDLLQQIQIATEIRQQIQHQHERCEQIEDPVERQRAARQALYESRSTVLRLCALTEAAQGSYALPSYDHYVEHFQGVRSNLERSKSESSGKERKAAKTPPLSDKKGDLKDIILGRKRPTPHASAPPQHQLMENIKSASTSPPANATEANEVHSPSAAGAPDETIISPTMPAESTNNDDPSHREATGKKGKPTTMREQSEGSSATGSSGLNSASQLWVAEPLPAILKRQRQDSTG